jgi:hypothetical protein
MTGGDLFLAAMAASFVCLSGLVVRFIAGGSRYTERSDPDYERLTIGNPLNALFIERLLTHDGLVLRGWIGRLLLIIWAVFLIVAIIVTNMSSAT